MASFLKFDKLLFHHKFKPFTSFVSLLFFKTNINFSKRVDHINSIFLIASYLCISSYFEYFLQNIFRVDSICGKPEALQA